MDRLEELAERARARLSDTPWPQLREQLLQEGATEEELDRLVGLLFPGRRPRHWLWGLVGAAAGVLFWALFLKR